MARLRPLGTIGLATTYAAQYLSAAALVGGSAGLFLGSVGLSSFEDALHSQIALLIVAGLIFVPGLFFLMPNRFDRALASMRYGSRRLMGSAIFVLLGGATVVGWVGIKLIYDIFDEPRGVSGIMALTILAWMVTYTLSFFAPGLAFRREDPSDEPVDLLQRFRRETPAPVQASPKPLGRAATFADRRERHLEESSYSLRVMAHQAELQRKKGSQGQSLGFLGSVLMFVLFVIPLAPLKINVNLLPMGDYAQIVHDYGLIIALAASALAFPFIYRSTAGARGFLRKPVFRGLTSVVLTGVTFVLWMMSSIYVYPYIASFVTPNTYGAVVVTLVERDSSEMVFGCRTGATVAMAENPEMHWRICGIPNTIWQDLEPGNALILTGETSPLGMRYQYVQLLG